MDHRLRGLSSPSQFTSLRGQHFVGVVDAHQLAVTIGQAVNDLESIAKLYEPQDIESRVEYLPL